MFETKDENLLLFSTNFVKQKEYWTNKLSGDVKKTDIAFDQHKTGNEKDGKLESLDVSFPGEVYSGLMKLSKESDISIYIVLLTVLKILIYRYSDNDDITLLSPVYKEKISEETINNCLFIRDLIEDGFTFKQLLLKVRQSTLEAYNNQDYPIEKLKEFLFGAEPDQGNNMITDIACSLQNIHNEQDVKALKSSISFSFERKNGKVDGNIAYDNSRYSQPYAEQLKKQFLRILENALQDVDSVISRIPLLSGEERKKLIEGMNNTKCEFPRDKTINRLFEEQVEKTPGNMALVFEEHRMTFSELNKEANRLAHLLREKGVSKDSRVAIMARATHRMIIAMLAVLKAGGSFLPIDPEIPANRIQYMFEDSRAAILLAGKEFSQQEAFKGEVIELDNPPPELAGKSPENMPPVNGAEDHIYMIYTSGTTGKPKGVLITHRNMTNYVNWFIKAIDVKEEDKAILTSSFAFDALYTQLFASLTKGSELHVISRDTLLASKRLLNYMKEEGITYIKVTPSLFNLMVNHPDFSADMFNTIRFIMLGGEPIIVKDADRVHAICPEIRIMNHYGPTETTIGSIAQFIDFDDFATYKTNPTIGKPIDNTDVYILDKNLCLLPYGVPGELCIGGEGVGEGYIDRPKLTAEKFISDPFKEGNRVYRTGDLAKWEADGNIKLLGRIDRQIKLRGYRIELGEIENRLLELVDIKEVVVLNKVGSKGDNYICAYYVSDKEQQSTRIREKLEKELPDYMVPSYFVPIEKIPLTPHNKIDYKALPQPKEMVQTGSTYEAPTNETEEKIVQIWGEILEIDPGKIGINDNFFELGGNSFNILKVLNRINHEFGQDISLSALFLYSTVKDLAVKIFEDLLLNKLECIVKLNHGQNDKNLFIVHPKHGMVYEYVELARLLEDEFNVYGIQVRGLLKRSKFPESYHVMVADYANQILQIQEEGTFYIAGYCFGNAVAYNVSKQLEELGHQVGVFILFDEEPFVPKFLSNHYRRKDLIEKILKPVHRFLDMFRKEKHKDAPSRRFNRLVAEAQAGEADSKNEPPISTDEAAKLKVKAKINIENLIALYAKGSPYKERLIGILNAPLINVNAAASKYKFSPKQLKEMTYGDVGTVDIGCGHNALFESPNVEKLQTIVRDILNGKIVAVK